MHTAKPTVNLGTFAQETAITNLAPFFAIPPASALFPTIKPVMFCRKINGMPLAEHNSIKCAPFNDDSENKMPLLAIMPIGYP